MGVEHEETQAAAPVSAGVETAPAPLVGAGPAGLRGGAGAQWSLAQIVSLQRTAGNAAVTRMLAREPDPAAPPAAGDGGAAQRLLSGAFDDTGDYKPDGTGFASGELDGLLKQTGSGWGGGIDTASPPTGQSADGSHPSGGDSAGKSVGEHPPWVAAFQNKLIGVLGQWSPDDKVAQRLMQVFLRTWTRLRNGGGMAANVAVFYQYAGAHEENAASQGLGTAGAKGVEQSNWCQQASTYAICEALLRNGLRFKSAPGQESKEKLGSSRINEVAKQAGKYETWLKGGGGGRTAWGGDKCWASAISPGDVFSFYSAAHGPTATGHVVTAVTGANAGEETAITVVSGNAGGEAVRVEEIQRVQPPPGLFSGSTKRPSGSKQVWIWSLQRSSILNAVIGIANSNQQFSDADIQAAGLERCKRLDEIWPAAEAVASTGSGGGAPAGQGAPTPAGGGASPTTETPAGGGSAPAGGGAAPAPSSEGPAPPQAPDPASGGGEPAPAGPAPAAGGGAAPASGGGAAPAGPAPADAGLGALGEWFQSLSELVFGDTGSEQEETATKNGPAGAGAAGSGAGSQWFSS